MAILTASGQSNIFTYANKMYSFVSFLSTPSIPSIALLNDNILSFQYVNELNNLVLSGELIYKDRNIDVDKILQDQISFLHVQINELDNTKDGNISINDTSKNFTHKFLIKSIEILNRERNVITYKFNLVSINWLKCVKHIQYSNHDIPDGENILTIIKNCFSKVGLSYNANSFNDIIVDISMKFITGLSDNLSSIINFLMNRLFYYETQKDTSVKFIAYNDINDEYSLFDVAKNNYAKNFAITLSFFRTLTKSLINKVPINLASVTKFPTTKQLESTFTQKITSYDYDKNIFVDNTIDADSIISYINNKPQVLSLNGMPDKYNIFSDEHNELIRGGSYWNNNLNIYKNITDSLCNNNALVVSSSATFGCVPSSVVGIVVDRNIEFVQSDTNEEYKKIMAKYKTLEGGWFVGKVRHFIVPNVGVNNIKMSSVDPNSSGMYIQNLTLFRNFKTV